MTSRDFAYWLQGFFEISEAAPSYTAGGVQIAPQPMTMTAEQVTMVKRHLAMVFIHEIDPSFGGKGKQDKLDAAHGGKVQLPLHGGDPNARC